MAADQLSKKCPDGTVLGQSGTDLVAMWGATPIAQAAALTAPAATAATNSSPYGYTQAQADALIVAVRAICTALHNAGIVA